MLQYLMSNFLKRILTFFQYWARSDFPEIFAARLDENGATSTLSAALEAREIHYGVDGSDHPSGESTGPSYITEL